MKHLIFIGCAFTLVVYAPWLDFGMIGTFDDAGYITNHNVVQDWWGSSWSERLLTPQIGYPIPLPAAVYALANSFSVDLFTMVVRGLGLLAHLVGGLFMFGLVRRLLSLRDEIHAPRVAALLTTLWLLHPVQVESVMWLSNLKSTFSVASVLGVMWFAQRLMDSSKSRVLNISAGLFLFLCGLASKPTAIIALPMMAVLPLLRDDSRGSFKKLLALFIPALVLGVAVALIAFGDHGDFAKVSAHVDNSPSFRIQQGLLALSVLIRSIVLPFGLSPNYTHPPEIPWTSLLPGTAIFIGFTVFITTAWRRARRDVAGALLLTGLAWAPFSHIVFLPRFAADTYASLPLFGILLTIGLVLPRTKSALIGGLGALVVLVLLTSFQIQRWEDGEALWGPELSENPLSVSALQHVSYAQFQRGDAESAIQTINEHYAAFRTHGRYPVWIGEFMLANDPLMALNFATEAVIHSAKNQLTENHYFLFLRALAAAQVPLPDAPEVQKVYQEAKDLYDRKPEWQKVISLSL